MRKKKFSDSDANDIRWLYFKGQNKQGKRFTMKELAGIYNCHRITILLVINRKNCYSHLPIEPEGD
jgi:hypothetical protein